MAKFYGKLGFAITEENAPGVWVPRIIKKNVYGDLIKNSRGIETSDTLNSNINISNKVSFIADPYARENFHLIKFCEFMGTSWIVKNIDVKYPRLILTLGGVYNGEQA